MSALVISNMSEVIEKLATENVGERGEASNGVPSQVDSVELDVGEGVKHIGVERKGRVFGTRHFVGRNEEWFGRARGRGREVRDGADGEISLTAPTGEG